MGAVVMMLLLTVILKMLAEKIYADCKISIWLTMIVTVVLAGWLISVIFDKILLIPFLLLL